MKKSELIKLIQEKASQIEVKDLSSSILERAQHLPIPVVQEKKSHFFIKKPAFIMSLVTLTAVLIFLFMLSPTPPTYTFDDLDTVFANSSMTSISLLSATLDIDLSTSEQLSFAQTLSNTYQADEQVDQVLDYLGATESLLNNLEISKTENGNNYQYHMLFSVIDLLDEVITYHIYYNQVMTKKNIEYTYEGLIVVNEFEILFRAPVFLGENNRFEFRIDHENQESVVINYQDKNNQAIYQVERLTQNVSNQKVEMKHVTINNEKQVMVNFIEGQTIGTYSFSKTVINEKASMRVQYLIRGIVDEDGEITITPRSSELLDIEIKPRGMAPIMIERGRRPVVHPPGHRNPFLTHI
jgi:acyl-CoA thioesterase FadM